MVENSNIIELDTLNLEELSGVISLYPWYAQARAELCRRMAALGQGAWSEMRFAQEALYIGSRKLIAKMLESGRENPDYSDAGIAQALKKYASVERRVVASGSDFFSQEDYDSVQQIPNANFHACLTEDSDPAQVDLSAGELADFYTETLAGIYLDQGFSDKAKEIYSQLSLRYPEKSVYFAGLIEKIDKKI